MNRTDIHRLMIDFLHPTKIKDSENWVMCNCPFASEHHINGVDNKLSFGISIGESSSYNCFACGNKGKLHQLPKQLPSPPSGIDTFITENEKAFNFDISYKIPPLIELDYNDYITRYQIARPQFHINEASIKLWEIRFDPHNKQLLFPIFDDFGRLVGIKGRDVTGKSPYKFITLKKGGGNPKATGIWYGMHFPLTDSPLILVEGERDAILLKQSGVSNVWASMGASLSGKQIQAIRNYGKRIILYFDNDPAGKLASKNILKSCKGLFPIEYITDYFGTKDPAEAVEKYVLKEVLMSRKLVG